MDVKFINPFLYGTIEILEKMAFIKPVAGKPFLKTDDSACGDVSGIIGMTGDISGSIALTFDKECIIDLTNQMLGENHTEINNEVLDTAGELTNIISGAARKIMEKDNLKVFAAIPTIIYGRGHTVRHAIKGPSIILPFQTGKGTFVIDICIKSQPKQEEARPNPLVQQNNPFAPKKFDPKAVNPAVFGRPSMPLAGPGISQAKIGQDLNNPDIIDSKDPAERLVQLKRILMEAIETRDSIMSELKKFPFMDATQRQRYRKALPAYDAKIKRLKLDIMAAETICKMGKEYLDNPQIKTNFQNYATG